MRSRFLESAFRSIGSKPKNVHPGCNSRPDAGGRVFDDSTAGWDRAELPGREQEDIWCGLRPLDVGDAEDLVFEMLEKAGSAQREPYFLVLSARRHTVGNRQDL